MKESTTLVAGPDLAIRVEEEKASVGSPMSATGIALPVGKKGMKIRTVGGDFPKAVVFRETAGGAIGRPTEKVGQATDRCQFMRASSIASNREDLSVGGGVGDETSIGRPGSVIAYGEVL